MKEKNKILIISHLYLFPEGILKRGGLIIHKSLINLAKTGKEVEVIFYLPLIWSFVKCFKFDWRNITFSYYEIDNIKIYPIFYVPRLSKKIARLDSYLKLKAFNFFYKRPFLKNDDIMLLYGQTLYPDGPLLPQISKDINVPFIVNMRGSDVHSLSAKNKYIHKQSQTVLNNALFAMSVSEKLQSISIELFKKNTVKHILYTVCQTDIFKNIMPLRAKLNKFIFIGALVKEKGIYEILKSFSFIVKEDKEAKLTLVGGGGDMRKINRLIQVEGLSNHIVFEGKISNREILAEKINEADILLFPSYNEGLPNVVVEAVACERAVIATDVGGIKEIGTPNIAFQLVPKKNVEAIVKAVKLLKNKKIENIRKCARQNSAFVCSRFSPDAQLKSFYKMLEKLD